MQTTEVTQMSSMEEDSKSRKYFRMTFALYFKHSFELSQKSYLIVEEKWKPNAF